MNQSLKYILQKGKYYKPAVSPNKIQRGDLGRCGDTCVINAINGPWRYADGLAMDPKNPGKWILHAWLTDGVHAYDPTWKCLDKEGKEHPVPTAYVGFEMDTESVLRFMLSTKHQGVIANAFRRPRLAKRCLPESFPITRIKNVRHLL